MGRSLNQDYDSHLLFTFAEIPESPPWANRAARAKRWFTIAFAESWLAAWLYRAKVRLRDHDMVVIPTMLDMLSRALFDVSIGNGVEIGPGLMMTHGHVVIDGRTRIGKNCQISPWVTIGLSNSKKLGFSLDGPTIGDDVHLGTGAKILGPISIGDHARIGANAVVVHDVPANVTAVGAPARVVGVPTHPAPAGGDSSRRDERLAARMHEAVVSYKLHRQSLKSLIDTLIGSFEIGSDALRFAGDRLKEDLIFLDAVAATGGEESQQVMAAIDAIDAVVSARARG